jgi:hypothetical protein
MEQFFTPIRRLELERQVVGENDIADGRLEYAEVQLRSTITVVDFLVYRWDWEDLCAFVGDGDESLPKIIWITENAYLELGDVCGYHVDDDYASRLHARFTATSGREQQLTLFLKCGEAPVSSEECSVFWRAITTSNCVKLNLQSDEDIYPRVLSCRNSCEDRRSRSLSSVEHTSRKSTATLLRQYRERILS